MIKTILINGATSGLGKQLSIFFDKKEKKLICLGKDKKKMLSLKKKSRKLIYLLIMILQKKKI